MFKQHSFYFFTGFLIVVFLAVRFALGFDGLYGQDAYEYLRYTEALTAFLQTGKLPGDYFWGVYYPILGSLLNFVVTASLALQLISVLSLLIASVYLQKIIQLLYKEPEPETLTFLFFTLSPIALIHSLLNMSDMLACGLTTATVFHFLNYTEKRVGFNFIIAVSLTVVAVLTRYAAIVVIAPFAFSAFIRLIQQKDFKTLLLSVIPVGVLVVPHLLIRSQNSLQFLNHQWLQSWSFYNIFRNHFITVDGEMQYPAINLVYSLYSFFHPIYFLFGIFLVMYLIWKKTPKIKKQQQLLLVAIVLYGFFLAGIPFQNKRFLLLSFPLVIAFLFPFLKQMLGAVPYKKTALILIFLIQCALFLFFGKSFYERNRLEKTIAVKMLEHQNQTLYAFDIDIALQGRNLDFHYRNLWKEKYSDYEKNALLLINEKQVEKQWKGKNPLLNWENLKQNYELRKLENLNGDFNLYRIVGKK